MTIDILKEYHLLTDEQLAQFEAYYELLTYYNKQFNLTAIRQKEEIFIKHFVDAILYSNLASTKEGDKVLDLGSGAGLPGIPFSILYPNKEVVLVDALNKRVNFLRTVIDALKLPNTVAIHDRGEALGKDPLYRETFDIVLARSVAYLPVLSEYLLPFVNVGQYAIITKEAPYEEEVAESKKAIALLGGKIEQIKAYTLPIYGNQRAVIFIKKIKKTPAQYPRRSGTPTKKPL